jgi:hypothetical protein
MIDGVLYYSSKGRISMADISLKLANTLQHL